MPRFKSLMSSAIRWGWFGLLVLLAFGYLVAGLSEPTSLEPTSVDPASQALSAVNTSVGASLDEPQIQAQPQKLAESLSQLDQVWLESLTESGLKPAQPADWLTVCRRVSLALVGSGMSLEEIRDLQRIPELARCQKHLENLLNDSRFHHYWGERWTRFLVGTDEGQFIVYRRRRFRIWLTEQFASDVRYDDLVKHLIMAEGLWTDRPEVNFLTSTYDSNDNSPDPVRLAARTSRAFLGLRIDCLQCHNDFLGNVSLGDAQNPREGQQTDFHQLAAFFTSAKSNGLQGVKSGEADYQYKYLDADEETDVQPAVPYLPELLPSEGNARNRLASWITNPQNRQAARAAVSHVWALMYGRPAGEAVDNLPLGSKSNPMLEWLADDFVENDFDLRRLIRLIALSGAFNVDSRADFDVTEAMESAGAVFPLVRLRPEQVAGSMIQAARIKSTDRESSLILQLTSFTGNNEFVERYGDIGEDEFSTDSVTITQRLLMMNGKKLRELTEDNPVLNTTAHARMFAADDPSIVETVYLCVLNRYPTDEEKTHFVNRITETKKTGKAIEDMMWVLLNSSELAWNH
ncbi:DUF1549 domain-containing protein [Rubripirellula reticaptiva]|uniref:Planctomycete cytochrome C n=1 Tax=Rubripirellula reticaptiva TaxID=2528013 RepID=A0A5C6F6S0_9BACT|nr:DUF1549 domain-containing protein [Rubripirellula reticaptiva]TWU55519.1 hypothetical protein Poly59_18180 [Rubripirellula reticaptiva]